MLRLVSGFFLTLTGIGVMAFAQNSGAPMGGTPAAKSGTRLITLGTLAGPPPRAHRAQSSNQLTVNGTRYVIDAGDGVVRRLAKGRRQYPRHRHDFYHPSS